MPNASAGEDDLAEICAQVAGLHSRATVPPHRIRVQHGTTTVEAEWPEAPAPAAVAAAGAVAEPDEGDTEDRAGVVVRAPLLGTFYSCPKPGAEPFVRSGDIVAKGQQIAIVEAMKLLNPVLAEVDGVVGTLLVADATPVEFASPLVVIHPVPAEVPVPARAG